MNPNLKIFFSGGGGRGAEVNELCYYESRFKNKQNVFFLLFFFAGGGGWRGQGRGVLE